MWVHVFKIKKRCHQQCGGIFNIKCFNYFAVKDYSAGASSGAAARKSARSSALNSLM